MPAYVEDGIPFLRSLNVDRLRINDSDLKTIDAVAHDRLRKSTLHPGDVVIVRTGRPGACAVIPPSLPVANCSDLVIVRCGRALDPWFLAYYINSAAVHGVSSQIVGAVQQHFNIGSARDLKIRLPDLATQREVVEILRALDDKIELNRRMSQTLESMARALFKSWFVDFDPVRAKAEGREPGVPMSVADVFPESFQDSEIGEIPQGWRVSILGERLVELVSGARPRGGSTIDGVPSIGAENVVGLGRYDFQAEKFVPEAFFLRLEGKGAAIRDGDVLLYKDGAQIGRKTYFESGFPHVRCAVNEHVFILRTARREDQRFLFFWLDQGWMTQEIVNLNSNSAQPGINQVGVRGLKLLIPPDDVVVAFDRAVAELTRRLFATRKEAVDLAGLRDAILPKLISGSLRAADQARTGAA
jgi:type I restriction enzyme S subunit